MKVSNNALNFLLAQYRAIFKRAYVKGLASAVILTAGLAASQAQAVDVTGAESWEAAATMAPTVISGDDVLKANGSAGEYAYFNSITIQSGNVTTENDKYIVLQGALTIGAEGKLTMNTSGSYGLLGHNKDADADVTTHDVDVDLINRGEFVVGKNNNANFNDVTLYSGSTVTISEAGGSAKTVANTANLFGGIGSGGNMDIQKGAKVTLNDYSQLGIEADNGVDAAASKLTINGEIQMKTTVESGSAIIRAVDNGRGSDPSSYDRSVIELGKDGTISVSGSGAMGIFAAEATLNGTIDVQNGALRLDGDLTDTSKNLKAMYDATTAFTAAGQYIMTDGTIKLDTGTKLVVGNGKYTEDNPDTPVDETKQVTTLNIQGGKLTGTGTVQVAGKFAATAGIVDAFLSGKDADGKANSNDGHFEFTNDASVFEVTGSDQFDLAKYTFSGTGATTDFILTKSGTIAGENLAVTKALTKNGTEASDDAKSKLLIDAVNLTLGSDTYAEETTLNFHSATARNLTLVGKDNKFTLADAITVAAIDEVDNPFLTEEGKLKVAADGQLNLEDKTTITGGDTKGLTIAAGNFESNADITIKSGALTVGNQTIDTDEGYGVDASLALTGKLTLDNSTGDNTITIAGNGSQTIKADTGVTVEDRTATSTLDLTGVRDITITGNASKLNTFKVNDGGELLLSTNAFNSILDLNNKVSNSGAEVVVSGGYVYVEGSIQGQNGSEALDVAKITSSSTAATDQIRFSGDGGILEARDTIWLEDKTGSGTLKIGSNELRAQTFRLDAHGTAGANGTTTYDTPFKVESGILTAGARVESSHDNAIQLGNGTTGATLNLGYIEDDVDEWGQKTYTYTTSSATGSVDTNIVLSGGSAAGSGSALNVVFGDWSAKDITVTSGTVTVGYGDADKKYDADGNEVVYNASLTGNKLTLNAGATATVNSNGKATFNELSMTAGTLTVNGEMTVNGHHVAADPDASPAVDESWGVNLAAGSAINVSGRNARLTFGGDAVSAISIDSDNKGVTVQTGTFGKTIDVTGFATLGLNFAEGTTFNADTLKDLRTALLSNSTNGAALTDGYINLGAARIEGVTVTNGTIDWNQLKDFADIDQLQDIITDDMSNATLVNANGTDTIQGNVGNIQLDGNQQTVQLGDVYLANSSSNNENGNFIFNETNPAQAGNANIVGGAHVTFANGGNVGAVSLATGTANGGETIFNVVSQDPAAETNITSISAGDNTLVNISAITNVAQNVNADAMQVDSALNVTGNVDLTSDLTDSFDTTGAANGAITAANLDVNGETAYHGNLDIAGNADFGGETYLGGNNKFTTRVTFGDYTELDHGTTEAGRVVLNGAAASLDIIGDAVLNAQVVDAAAGQTIHVGEESSTDVGYTGDEPWESSAGYFFAERVDLNGATIMADPAFGKAASMVGIGQLGDTAAITTGNDAGTLL